MKPLAIRRLTPGERALAAEMFGNGLDAGRVRLLALPVWDRAFVAGPRLMVWAANSALNDFANAPLHLQAVFVHELTHVWQAQNGVRLLLAKIRAGDRPSSYAYDLAGDPDFSALNIEQQAMVVEHAFLSARGGTAPYGPERYANLRSSWRKA